MKQTTITFPIRKSLRSSLVKNRNENLQTPKRGCSSTYDSTVDTNEEVSPTKRAATHCEDTKVHSSLSTTPKLIAPASFYQNRQRELAATVAVSRVPLSPPKDFAPVTKAFETPSGNRQKFKQRLVFGSSSGSMGNLACSITKAKSCLSVKVPQQLYCRDDELSVLRQKLTTCIKSAKPLCLYISGPPGSGKSACLSFAIDKLKDTLEFQDIYVNCMNLRNPFAVFKFIAQELGISLKTTNVASIIASLEKRICSGKLMIVLMLDEIDQLSTKDQTILYGAFSWPFLANSKLALIGVANSFDLTERCLPKLNCALAQKPDLLHFKPYNKSEIVNILKNRLQETDGCLEPAAVELCARKVSSVTGDIRKALDICCLAIEHMERRVTTEDVASVAKVNVSDVAATIQEVYGNKIETTNATLPMQQKLLLAALLRLHKAQQKEVSLSQLFTMYKKACTAMKLVAVDQSECSGLCNLLESQGLISITKAAKDSTLQKLKLAIDENAVEATLKDQALLSSVLSLRI